MTKASLLLVFLCASTTLAICSTALRVSLKHLDANLTLAERLGRGGAPLHRRLGLISGVTTPVVSLDDAYYAYIAEFSIGSPPQVVQLVVSTSSDLVLTQCSTCRPRCFEQGLDYYDYHKSSTGQPVRCDDTRCAAAYGNPCADDDKDGACLFQHGALRIDEFTFGPAKLNVTFGCMSLNNAHDNLDGASGFVGLGKGELSLVSQVGSTRFSYCLTRHDDRVDSSPLFIGSSAGLSGDAPVTSTPFYANTYGEGYSSVYFVSMSGMSVGEASLNIAGTEFNGGVAIDTSAGGMYLVDGAYMALKEEMTRQLGSILVPSPVEWLELCVAREHVRMIAPLVLHLGGGDLALPADNYWGPVDLETSCMMVVSSGQQMQMTVIGSYMQQDLHVLFDLDDESISFQPADCASM